MQLSITDNERDELLGSLGKANLEFQRKYPGDKPDRQPVHTVYGGANLFKSDTAGKMGEIALRNFQTYAPDAKALREVLSIEDVKLSTSVYDRIIKKLQTEPVEDFRIDFEDGFGNRPDAEEDATAERAAKEVAIGMSDGTISPFIGIRVKPFTEELKARGVRTLDIFISTFVEKTGGRLPENFV